MEEYQRLYIHRKLKEETEKEDRELRGTIRAYIRHSMRKFGATDQDTEDRERWRNLSKGNL